MSDRHKPTLATYLGLFFALAAPLLLYPLHLLQTLHWHPGFWQQEAVIWGLTALVLCILVFGERLPLSSIGLGRPGWSSLIWGIGGAFAARIVAALVLIAYAKISGASLTQTFAHDVNTATKLGAFPLVFLFLLALRAGVTEEILFRGYGIERLAAVTGSRTVAATVCLVAFTAAHLGTWDVNYLILVFPVGLVLTLQYLWRRDLWSNILAHFFTDAAGFLGAYAIAHHLIDLKPLH
jgi:membrane protease YdiL (CAAX protease family)